MKSVPTPGERTVEAVNWIAVLARSTAIIFASPVRRITTSTWPSENGVLAVHRVFMCSLTADVALPVKTRM